LSIVLLQSITAVDWTGFHKTQLAVSCDFSDSKKIEP